MDTHIMVEKEDIEFLKGYLQGKSIPVEIDELTLQLALFKTREQRSRRVKIYNPNCEYQLGELIYKEYPGRIPVGSKKFIEITEGVVLRVAEVRQRYELHEIKLIYEGTSEFKKYTDFLDRQKIEILLPHKQESPCEKPEYLENTVDPRQEQAPLLERDFTHLKRKLVSVLNREAVFAFISNRSLLAENLKAIEPGVFDRIKEFLKERQESIDTEFLVENFVRVEPKAPDFTAYCFALNYKMKITYKIDFQQTSDENWGKWNLITVIYYFKKNSILNDPNPLLGTVQIGDRKNITQKRRKFEEGVYEEGWGKLYLTQREIYAGGVRVKPGTFDLGDAAEVEMIDARIKKPHTLYYYQDVGWILGFKEIFERNKAVQGTILILEQAEAGKIHFSIRTTKKGTVCDKIEYDPVKKAFHTLPEKWASPVFVHKAMFLEGSTIDTLYGRIDEFRHVETFNKLVHKVFLEFGVKERNYEIHFLKLFHILDLIYPVETRVVEEVLLGNIEFVPSEKLPGVFYLDSAAVAEIEGEEVIRRKRAVDESKKSREDLKKKKIMEEIKVKEEIKRKRDDRRKRREDDMWYKERLEKERLERETLEKESARTERERRERERKERLAHERVIPDREGRREAVPRKGPETFNREKETGRPGGESTFKPRPDFPRPKREPLMEEPLAKSLVQRKEKKKPEGEEKRRLESGEERGPKSQKRAVVIDETLTEEEIKSEIQLEELKETISLSKQRAFEKAKKKEVAYRDNGGFGGILASKLDEAVKKSEPDKDKKEKDAKK